MADDDAPTGDKNDKPEGKTFTQEDLDRIVQERLARVKPQKPDDYDDLKAKAAKLDELEQANQSELDKLLARAEAAEKRADVAEERAKRSDVRSAVMSAATAAGAIDADAVFALLGQDAVTIGDDGQVTGADEAVKALLEAKPYLVGKSETTPKSPKGITEGGPRGSADGPKQLSRDDLTSMKPEQIEAARQAGQLADLMSGG